MTSVDNTVDGNPTPVERGEDVREIANPVEELVLDLDALTCTGILPPGTCLAIEHLDVSYCRPDDMCWQLNPDLHHVNHQCPCWHEVRGTANSETPWIQNLLVDAVPADEDDGTGADPDPAPAPVEIVTAASDPFLELRDGIYLKLRAEGISTELAIVLATIYAQIVPSQIPETMALLRSVGESIGGVLGDGKGGGMMGKLLGRAMKGNG
jgi:hypothetical protein